MQIDKKDADSFYKMYKKLLFYTNQRSGILKELDKPEDIGTKQIDIRYFSQIRDYLYSHLEIFDSFVEENQKKISDEEIATIKDWKKNFIKKDFYIMEHLKEYTAFFDGSKPEKIYGVLGLYSPMEEVVLYTPCIVTAVLLPFKNHIIYDGLIAPYMVTFGPTMRKDLIQSYKEVKAKFGIITSLPFSPKEVVENDENLLKFYLKSQGNREYYSEEIHNLTSENEKLLTVYYQEIGRHNAAKHSKRLKEFITSKTNIWFAIIDDVIITSGKTKEDVEKNLDDVLPNEKRNFAYIFKVQK